MRKLGCLLLTALVFASFGCANKFALKTETENPRHKLWYQTRAVVPWAGMLCEIAVVDEIIQEQYPNVSDDLTEYNVMIIPNDGCVLGSCGTRKDFKSKYPDSPYYSGTVSKTRDFLTGRFAAEWFAWVRQVAIPDGTPRWSPDVWLIAHEILEHVALKEAGKGINRYHKHPEGLANRKKFLVRLREKCPLPPGAPAWWPDDSPPEPECGYSE